MFRVTTRADWDGLVCAALLSVVEDVDRIRFIEPGPFQDGELEVTPEDIIANLPYRKGCAMWFDHHISNKTDQEFRGSWWVAPSAARIIYEYYTNGDLASFDELVRITDRIDGATLTEEEVGNPQGFVLVSMTVEGKRELDEPYWLHVIELLKSADDRKVLEDPQVRQKCEEFLEINREYGEAINLYSDLEGNVLVTDLRKVWSGEPGNRFLAYSIFPQCDTWVKISDHPNDPGRTHIAVGHSIFRRTNQVNVGDLMHHFGGGGHKGAGSCRPKVEDADRVLKEVVEALKKQNPHS